MADSVRLRGYQGRDGPTARRLAPGGFYAQGRATEGEGGVGSVATA
jgi:hypothetical protein